MPVGFGEETFLLILQNPIWWQGHVTYLNIRGHQFYCSSLTIPMQSFRRIGALVQELYLYKEKGKKCRKIQYGRRWISKFVNFWKTLCWNFFVFANFKDCSNNLVLNSTGLQEGDYWRSSGSGVSPHKHGLENSFIFHTRCVDLVFKCSVGYCSHSSPLDCWVYDRNIHEVK